MKKDKGQLVNLEIVRNEVKETLKKVQEGYIKRDVSIIDQFMNELVFKDDNVFAVGTGDDEWCFGRDEVKELFESDWQYWGDLTFDTDNPILYSYGDIVWVAVQGYVKYEFKDDKETYERYLKIVRSHFDDSDEMLKKMSQKEKLATINYILTHKMRDREQKVRQYNWPVTFTGILIHHEQKWVFKYMQFSMATPSIYPDIRFNREEEYVLKFNELKTKMKKFKEQLSEYTTDIERTLEKFESVYLNDSIKIVDMLSDFFCLDEDIRVIATDGTQYEGVSKIVDFVSSHRKKWNKMSLDIDETIINSYENIAWFVTNGVAKKSLNEKEVYEKQVQDLEKIFDTDACAKEKLFRIQRNISLMQKELSKGEDFVWPFRLEGVMINCNGKWLIHRMHFSYPFSWILEGKYDVEVLK